MLNFNVILEVTQIDLGIFAKKVTVGHYVVYYQVDLVGKIVTVIRIFYGGREVKHIIGEEPGSGPPAE